MPSVNSNRLTNRKISLLVYWIIYPRKAWIPYPKYIYAQKGQPTLSVNLEGRDVFSNLNPTVTHSIVSLRVGLCYRKITYALGESRRTCHYFFEVKIKRKNLSERMNPWIYRCITVDLTRIKWISTVLIQFISKMIHIA